MANSKTPATIGGVGITVIVVVAILFLVSLPSLDVTAYIQPTPNSSWSHAEFNWSIQKIHDKIHYEPTTVCFRIDNVAESMLSPAISANNFRVTIQTNAECKECNTYADLELLEAQNDERVCKDVAVPSGLKEVSFDVISSWTTLRVPFENTVTFSCTSTNESDQKIDFTCNRS